MHPITPAPQYRRAIARWLMLCLCLVALMVAVGGVTRLTESGLSIVEWKLFSGTLPPLNDSAWQAEFNAYKATPQFKKVNAYFTVGDFKRIYWLEYIHRLLGRIIGLAVVLPLAYFAARYRMPRQLVWRCLAIAALVSAQGTVGWLMVASGLNDQPRVAPIKLGTHLLLAFTVFGLMLWTRWQVLDQGRPAAPRALARLARLSLGLLILQIFMGALVAGLRAGLTYNTWPLMDGKLIPNGLQQLSPWWLNHMESIVTVQFQHRMVAMLLAAVLLVLAWLSAKSLRLRPTALAIAVATLLQFSLGVATLLTGVNLWLASAHQLVALTLVALLVRALYLMPLDINQHLR